MKNNQFIRKLPEISKVLFLDIETVPAVAQYENLSNDMANCFDSKFGWIRDTSEWREKNRNDTSFNALYDEKAGVCSEFLQIVAVAIGGLQEGEFKVKSFLNGNETKLLGAVGEVLNNDRMLCAHSGKIFDFPVLARRCLINGLPVPRKLDNYDVKPWDQDLLDTAEIWKCGQFKYSVSLALLCEVFGIKTKKNDIDGSKVSEAWKKKKFKEIGKYVRSDVIDLAKVYSCFLGENFSYLIKELDEKWK